MILKTNISTIIREIDLLGKAVLKDIGEAVAEAVWEEFEVLVEETPQWSGTTAASWELSMKGRRSAGSDYVEHMPERSKGDALQKGHMAAVRAALTRNMGNLDNIGTDYRSMDILVSNAAPGIEMAETGSMGTRKLRGVNTPAGALARFEARLSTKLIKPVRDRVI